MDSLTHTPHQASRGLRTPADRASDISLGPLFENSASAAARSVPTGLGKDGGRFEGRRKESEPRRASPRPGNVLPPRPPRSLPGASGPFVKGRGAVGNPANRYDRYSYHEFDDGWTPRDDADFAPPPLRTTVHEDASRSLIARNQSPDLGFDRSINPYRGCEHGCVYCFARPTHAYLGLSPGLDFEAQLFAKSNAAVLLDKELRAPSYRPRTIAIGTNTDPYQPVERERRITRSILETLDAFNHPVSIVTKSALVARDIDILAGMAERGLTSVCVSVTSLDRGLSRRMEPRAATPAKRLATIRALAEAGIPTGVMVAPVVPGLTDPEMEAILDAAREAGAAFASYIPLRLPLEVKDLMSDWLEEHYPDRAKRVFSLVRSMRDGKLNDPNFGSRMQGTGPFARLLERRFVVATRKLGLDRKPTALRTDLFAPPARTGDQLSLFQTA
jgi:DNA repair photolyase